MGLFPRPDPGYTPEEQQPLVRRFITEPSAPVTADEKWVAETIGKLTEQHPGWEFSQELQPRGGVLWIAIHKLSRERRLSGTLAFLLSQISEAETTFAKVRDEQS